jgi:hypothetical protein
MSLDQLSDQQKIRYGKVPARRVHKFMLIISILLLLNKQN